LIKAVRMTVGNADERSCHSEPSRVDVWRMFDRVARRYDLLNRLLSLGIDCAWRRKMATFLPPGKDLRVLDLATGTADQLLFLFHGSDRVRSGLGMDLAEKMLHIGRQKVARQGLATAVALKIGDAMAIPEEDNRFDVVTMAFGIRNMTDVHKALQEMYRVLKPGGRVLILEFSLPGNRLFRKAYLFYLRYCLPWIGAFVSGDTHAYRYLNKTIETFPRGAAFCRLLKDRGFTAVVAHPLTFGIATIYGGDKTNRGALSPLDQ
jgi:demethylmenaquinone methyltransferase/2-methoxy-6-polyprenyl-1,4-benzoquinol methylase